MANKIVTKSPCVYDTQQSTSKEYFYFVSF